MRRMNRDVSIGLGWLMLGILVSVLAGCNEDEITSSAERNGIPLGTPYYYGKFDQGAVAGGGWSPDFLQGVPITITHATYLNRLGMIVSGFSGSPAEIKMALYRDNAGVPGTLVVGSEPKGMSLGRNEFGFYPKPVSTDLYNDGGSQTRFYLAYPFANAWPNPFPTPGGNTVTPTWSIYMMVTD